MECVSCHRIPRLVEITLNVVEVPSGMHNARRVQQTIGNPHVQILSEDSAILAYARILQYQDK